METIQKIEIKNFKFFNEEFTIDLNGNNLLLYGENGAGKSSIYWALYTFMQSSIKDDSQAQKYFLQGEQTLRNVYSLDSDDSYVKVYVKNESGTVNIYEVSNSVISTNKSDNKIRIANKASDFVNYRVLSRLYDFRNSEENNLFSFFENEVFDYLTENEISVSEWWREIKAGLSRKADGHRKTYPAKNSNEYIQYKQKLDKFNTYLEGLLSDVFKSAQIFLNEGFKEDYEINFRFIKAMYDNDSDDYRHHFENPKILLKAAMKNDKKVEKPHIFFNEARLTAIALSLRFAVFSMKLKDASALKLMILDDLLISLDMSHRDTVFEILMSNEVFKNCQFIVLTHDQFFFEMAKQKFDFKQAKKWEYKKLYVDDSGIYKKPTCKPNQTYLERAKEFMDTHYYPECANNLRKETERLLKKYLDKTSKLSTLQNYIDIAKNQDLEIKTHEKLKKFFDGLEAKQNDFDDLINLDITTISDVNLRSILGKTKGFLRAFYSSRDSLKEQLEQLETVFAKLEQFKNFLFNPESHWDIRTPLFKKELSDAYKLIEKLRDNIDK